MRSLITLGQVGRSKLATLCRGLNLKQLVQPASQLFDTMSGNWKNWELNHQTNPRSGLSDDGSPFEFSVTFKPNKPPELRFMVEPQQCSPSSYQSNWDAGLQLNDDISSLAGVDLRKLNQIKRLLEPSEQISADALYAFWYGVDLHADGSFMFKTYFNLEAYGSKNAADLLKELLSAAELQSLWDDNFSSRIKAGEGLVLPKWLALDLSCSPEARTKIYLAYRDKALLEPQLQGCRAYQAGDAISWTNTLTSGAKELTKPVIVCYAFSEEAKSPVPKVYVPVRFYTPNDESASDLADQFLGNKSGTDLRSTITAIADRPLGERAGLLTYIGLRREPGGLSVTPYICPELYDVLTPKLGSRGSKYSRVSTISSSTSQTLMGYPQGQPPVGNEPSALKFANK